VSEKEDIREAEISAEVGRFTESYASFNNIINKMQRQYLSLKDTYTRQSEELQSVNESLQMLVAENRAVTEFLNGILNSLSSGVIAVDREGNTTHINPAARNILGFTGDSRSFYGRPHSELIKATEGCDISAVETVKTGRTFDNAEKVIETFYGTFLTLSVSTSVLQNNRGEVVGAVELFHDISKLKRMEEQLTRMKTLASLGEMAASIAHEIRNPLVGISGFASLLARDLEEDEQKKGMAKKIVEGVESINRTIQTLLDFARNEKVHKSSLDLTAYLNIVLDGFNDEYNLDNNDFSITRELAGDTDLSVDIDRQLFRQAIYNLIKNGLEAGGKDARVTIACHGMPVEQAQKEFGRSLGLDGTETLAEIVIEDNGAGIAREDIGKIFSPFYSTKENGTGLGLAIAWKIIKAHRGDIRAESSGSGGTKFTIVLPAKAEIKGRTSQ
jgi:PAS domain S-box-containing protein